MSNFDSNRRNREERRKNIRETQEIFGKYFFDLSKLSFAGMVVSVATQILDGANQFQALCVVCVGLSLTVVLAMVGRQIIKVK